MSYKHLDQNTLLPLVNQQAIQDFLQLVLVFLSP